MVSNPFSTCFFQPGSIEFQFFGRADLESLATSCINHPDCYVIVGPHGSGKSTLLRSLQRSFDRIAQDQPVDLVSRRINEEHSVLVQLCNDGKAGQVFRTSLSRWKAASVILLDGIEQLGWWNRIRAIWCARSLKRTLVATSHGPVRGCRILWQTSIDETTERWVVEQLLREQPNELVQKALESREWDHSRRTHGQNLRESLFDMYDWWQAQKS